MKIRSVSFSIIFILISMLKNIGINNVNENNIGNYIEPHCNSVADFIENNFDMFVDEYNLSNENNWQAEYIEKRFNIIVNECGKECNGVFLDFNANNGYAVLVDNYNFLDFSTEGSSPYENINTEKYYFSSIGGYYYLFNDEFLSVNTINNANDEFIYENVQSKHYDGQESNQKGCGKIIDTDKYMLDKYGEKWILDDEASLDMKGYSQWSMSCYLNSKVENDKLHTYSEGNCWAISAYTVLQYLADKKSYFSGMPKSTNLSTYIPSVSEPKIYGKYYDKNGNNISKTLYYNNNKSTTKQYKLRSTSFSFPKLYTDVRKFVNDKYKNIEGGSIWRTSKIIESIAEEYGYDINAIEHIAWGAYADKGTTEIDAGYPLLWSTSNDTYGSHTMAVCGYKYYSKTTNWFFFKTTSYKLFYELRDGHSTAPRFYDISGHIGFSTIISLDY